MKKVLYILLSLIIINNLTGCSNSKESMLEESKKISVDKLTEEIRTNFKKAKKKYVGNVYEIDAGVFSIEDKYAKLSLRDSYLHEREHLEVYFSDDDLEKLKVGQRINFVGKISDISKKDNYIKIEVKKAHYISDIIEITGSFYSGSEENCYNIPVENSYKIGGKSFKYSTKKRSCHMSHYCNFSDDKNDISYDFPYYYDECDLMYDLDIKEDEKITIKAKIEIEFYPDDDNYMISDLDWDITEIISVNNRPVKLIKDKDDDYYYVYEDDYNDEDDDYEE